MVKNAQPAPACSQPVPAEPCEIPLELQKPKANCRQLTQGNGADFVFSRKANPPSALAKAQQLLPGTLPPQIELIRKRTAQ